MTQRQKLVIFSALIFSLCFAPALTIAHARGLPQNERGMPSLAPIIKKAMPAVVNVATTGVIRRHIRGPFMNPLFQQFFGMTPDQTVEQPFTSLGSGVIINSEKGYIVTNYHVIRDASKIKVTLSDNVTYPAKIVGVDKQTDLAVLQIHAKDLHQLTLGDSANMQIGDFVIAIGEPLGLEGTATSGIISAVGRTGVRDPFGSYDDFIQTDAAINPGNSGGPLINMDGKVIGINTAIATTGSSHGNIGIGFAIPSNIVKVIVDQLIKYGKVERGLLGVEVQDLTPELARQFKLKPGTGGALITQVVKGSAAAKAGLKVGDVVVEVNGQPVRNSNMLRNYVGIQRVGTALKLVIYRNGKRMVIDAKVGRKTAAMVEQTEGHGKLGAKFSNLKSSSPLYGQVKGVQVDSVSRDGEAAQAGLQPGDVIIAVNRHPVGNLAAFYQALRTYKGTLLLTVRRGDMVFFTTIR